MADSTRRPQNSRSSLASSKESPDCAVIRAVFKTWSFGLDPFCRARRRANLESPVSNPAPPKNSRIARRSMPSLASKAAASALLHAEQIDVEHQSGARWDDAAGAARAVA